MPRDMLIVMLTVVSAPGCKVVAPTTGRGGQHPSSVSIRA